jgi:hypothetical protein
MCKKYGATAEQSFLIHADPSPEPVPAVPGEDEREWLDSQAQREGRARLTGHEVRRTTNDALVSIR